jgi:hypothetical protein
MDPACSRRSSVEIQDDPLREAPFEFDLELVKTHRASVKTNATWKLMGVVCADGAAWP